MKEKGWNVPRRKPKIEPIGSADYVVVIEVGVPKTDTPCPIAWPIGWFVRNRETCAETAISSDWEVYYNLKRTWRRRREEFDALCRFMKFGDLFSAAGIDL